MLPIFTFLHEPIDFTQQSAKVKHTSVALFPAFPSLKNGNVRLIHFRRAGFSFHISERGDNELLGHGGILAYEIDVSWSVGGGLFFASFRCSPF